MEIRCPLEKITPRRPLLSKSVVNGIIVMHGAPRDMPNLLLGGLARPAAAGANGVSATPGGYASRVVISSENKYEKPPPADVEMLNEATTGRYRTQIIYHNCGRFSSFDGRLRTAATGFSHSSVSSSSGTLSLHTTTGAGQHGNESLYAALPCSTTSPMPALLPSDRL